MILNEQKVFFSIVVPTYNRASLIEPTIQSLLQLNYNAFEIIVVDDGSTDNTGEVILNFNDPRINYYKKENAERGAARNFGAGLAKGDYVNFFDSDDIAYPNHLQTALEVVQKFNKPEMFHLGYDIITPQKKITKQVNNLSGNINLLLFKNGNIFSCNGVFLRRDIALKHPFIEDRNLAASEDAVLWMQLAARYVWHYSNEITSSIVDHETRSVLTINKEKLISRLILFVHYVTSDPEIKKKFAHLIPNVELEAWSYAAIHFALTGENKKDALDYWLKSVRAKPGFIFSKRSAAIIKRLIF